LVPGVSSRFQSMCDGRPDKTFLIITRQKVGILQ
jgi:hypothetical protein